MKNEISEKELLDFLNDLKNEVSSSKFWDNLDEDIAEKYDNFSSVELIAEFVVDYIIEKVREKLKENGPEKNFMSGWIKMFRTKRR